MTVRAGLLALLVADAVAAAPDDGVHGRFEGDLSLEPSVGVAVDDLGEHFAARFTASSFHTAGLWLAHRERLVGPGGEARRLAAGVLLRPLFLARWATDRQRGGAVLDLWLDSLGLELGVALTAAPGAPLGRGRGVSFAASTGLPLAGAASGPWLSARGGWYRAEPGAGGPGASVPFVEVGLGWHFLVVSPWAHADAGSGRAP